MKYFPLFFLITLFIYQITLAQMTHTGLIPVVDLKEGNYKGYQGGLYPGGSNLRPFRHDSLGMVFSKQIKPLDIQGNIDTLNGKCVLLSIGMSNTTQEFSFFKSIADTDKSKNLKLVIVDGAQGGQTAAIISNPNANFWNIIEQRLQSAGVNAKQVQICWVKEADAQPNKPFPEYAIVLLNELMAIAKNIKQKYPNCKIAYWSSRTYGGYATTTLNPEPFAYESGFSVKWLIEKQINGDTSLTCSYENPKAPWFAWGPYLWADGLTPRSDGLIWKQEDFGSDGTHPSTSGRKKVADLLLNFLKTDLTARKWFLKDIYSDIKLDEHTQLPINFRLNQNYPNPFNPATTISFSLPETKQVKLTIYNGVGEKIAMLVDDTLSPGMHTYNWKAENKTSGIYFYTMRAGAYSQTKKMILMK